MELLVFKLVFQYYFPPYTNTSQIHTVNLFDYNWSFSKLIFTNKIKKDVKQ